MAPRKANELFYLRVLLKNEMSSETLKILVCNEEVASSLNSEVNIIYIKKI